MATATYDLIASQTLGSAAASITFSSIAASWTDLRIVLVGQHATSSVNLFMRYNSDTATNYSVTYLYGDGSSATSATSTSQTYLLMTAGGNLTSTVPELFTVDIFSYNGSTYKTCLMTSSEDRNGTGYVERFVGLWRSTSAITSVTFALSSGNFAIGTTANLYGIKAA